MNFIKLTQMTQRQLIRVFFLVFGLYAATQQALQLQQECIQVMRCNKVVRRLPTKSNGTPAMDLGFEDIRICRYRNEKGRGKNTRS